MNPAHLLASALASPVEAGAEFAGHRLLDELGRGGMGVVFSASHLASKRIVALKMPLAGADAALCERFRGEARAAAALDHPHVLPIHEVGECGGVPFFTMRFAECGNLAARADEFENKPRAVAELIAKVADALQHAHERGLLHRDVTPSNILLSNSGEPLLCDFGLARWLGRDSTLTLAGSVLGTPSYLAPELLGKNAGATTASDLFSVGAVLHRLLCGRPPFEGASIAETLAKMSAAEPVSFPGNVPRDLGAICAKCLDHEPARRYATAALLATDLRNFLAGEPTLARPAAAGEKAWRWCRRRPALAALLALLTVVTVASFAMIDAARRAEIAAGARLMEALDLSELDRAESLFRAGDSAGALAPLVHILERNPAQPVAGPRLASALWSGEFAMPVTPPLVVGGEVLLLKFLRDGRTLLVATNQGAATWDAASGKRLLEFERGDERLFGVALSPDERTLAEWDSAPDKHFRLLDVATGRLCVPPIAHSSWLNSMEFSADSQRLLKTSSGPDMQIREARTGVQLGAALDHPPGQWGAAFSPDDETIATISDANVRFWESGTGRMRAESPALDRRAEAPWLDDRWARKILFSPDGRWLMASSDNGTVRLLATADGQFIGLPMQHQAQVRAAAFSADGTRLLTASGDHTARVWSVPGGEPLGPVLRHGDGVNFAAFSPDGTRIFTASLDNTARVWDAATGRPLTQPLRHYEQATQAVFSPDGATLFTGGADGIVQRWDLRAGAATGTAFPGRRAEFNTDGKRVIAVARGPFVRDAADMRPLAYAPDIPGELWRARFSPDGHRAAILARDGTGTVVPLNRNAGEHTVTIFHEKITDFCFNPDGTKLATASEDHTARVWDTLTGAMVTLPLVLPEPVNSVRFSPDGRTLLTATWSPRAISNGSDAARMWDAETGQALGAAMAHADDVRCAEFSPDGALVATASDDNTARVWDARTGAPVSPPLRHARSVVKVAFSPDSRRVATASWDGTARIWDARTGTPLTRVLTHADRVEDVRFSADGRRLATGSWDGTARIWDAASGHPLTEPLHHGSAVEQVCFHPDGERLLTSTFDGHARLWEAPDFSTPPRWLLQLAEAIALPELPPDPEAGRALIARYERTRVEALASKGDDNYARLARRLFAPIPESSIVHPNER